MDSSSVYYNPEVAKGLIASQSVSDGVLINNISELTIYINNGDKPHEDKDKDEVEDKDKEIEDNDSYQDEEKDDPLDMVLPSE